MAGIDVSVVVPFFNPGADLDDCLSSLVQQSLDDSRYEVVLVDDGSTDGSDARVEEWVSRHPELLSLHRIPASGGPARPRNVGVDVARGRYVQFVDSDDTMAVAALERLVSIADASDADIVVHKISGGGPRNIYHQLFRRTETGLTLTSYPTLIRNGTVCKMFRRDFLRSHDIRFPEGQTYIEDQYLCLRSYAQARSIAVVSDLVTYFHWKRRAGGEHFGDADVDPAAYRAEIEALLDAVDREVADPQTRFAVVWRYYRGEVLGRLRGKAMVDYDPTYRAALVDAMHDLSVARIPEDVHDHLTAMIRIESRLLRDGDLDGLIDFSRRLETLRVHATAREPRWESGHLVFDLLGSLRYGDEVFRFERDGSAWAIPQALAPGVDARDRRWTADDDADLDIDVASIARTDSALWSTVDGLSMQVDAEGTPRFVGRVVIDPATLAGGSPMADGVWDLRLRVAFSGLQRSAGLMPADVDTAVDLEADEGLVARAFWTRKAHRLAIAVGQTSPA
jgi:glycosyltransferase involved in cell wall biosynthesis